MAELVRQLSRRDSCGNTSTSSRGSSVLGRLSRKCSRTFSQLQRALGNPSSSTTSRKKLSRVPNTPEEYEFIEVCGKGASSTVIRARCKTTGKDVAVKRIYLDSLNVDLDLFVREARVMRELHHPNLLPLLGTVLDSKYLWLVTRYVRGGTFENILQHAYPDGLPEPVVATVAKYVLSALAYLHEQGVVHRDVKASNVLLGSNGTVYLGDLGAAARVRKCNDRDPSQVLRLQRTTFTGTVPYMSPELVEGTGYGEATDIWSLGVTLVELATAQRPHGGQSVPVALYSVLNDEPPGLPADSGFSSPMRDLVARCLVKDPAQRWSAARLLSHPAIRKYARDESYLKTEIMPRLPPAHMRARIYSGQSSSRTLRQGELDLCGNLRRTVSRDSFGPRSMSLSPGGSLTGTVMTPAPSGMGTGDDPMPASSSLAGDVIPVSLGTHGDLVPASQGPAGGVSPAGPCMFGDGSASMQEAGSLTIMVGPFGGPADQDPSARHAMPGAACSGSGTSTGTVPSIMSSTTTLSPRILTSLAGVRTCSSAPEPQHPGTSMGVAAPAHDAALAPAAGTAGAVVAFDSGMGMHCWARGSFTMGAARGSGREPGAPADVDAGIGGGGGGGNTHCSGRSSSSGLGAASDWDRRGSSAGAASEPSGPIGLSSGRSTASRGGFFSDEDMLVAERAASSWDFGDALALIEEERKKLIQERIAQQSAGLGTPPASTFQ